MKRFNLEEYQKDPSREVVTSDGRPVRIICTDRKYGSYPIIGLVRNCLGEDTIVPYSSSGTTYISQVDCFDLFFKPKVVKKWVNIYKDQETGLYLTGDHCCDTKDEAVSSVSTLQRISTVPIEWEE